MTSSDGAGPLLRAWRQRRNLSQLALAHETGVSARHISFVETGRSRPTSTMILRLCDHLDVPLREQNRLLLASGHAPAHPEHAIDAPPMADMHRAIELMMAAHLPFPALVIDRAWDLVTANDAAYGLLDGVSPSLLEPPVNVVRLSVHPQGLARRIVNLAEWRGHLVHRLRRDLAVSGDARLAALLAEVTGPTEEPEPTAVARHLVVPLRLRTDAGVLSFLSTTTVFGTPREVTLSELAIEAFYPADEDTRHALAAAG